MGLRHLRKFLHTPTRKQVVFITRSLQALVEAQLGEAIPAEETIIAPDGVDLERYADLPDPSAARKALHLPEKFTALYSGSFYQGRGMQMLFDLAVHFKEMTFLWVGGKPCEINEWQQKIRAAQLDNVILPGFVDNAALPELPGGSGPVVDAVQSIRGGFQRRKYRQRDQPDEIVRVYGLRTCHPHQRPAGAA